MYQQEVSLTSKKLNKICCHEWRRGLVSLFSNSVTLDLSKGRQQLGSSKLVGSLPVIE